MPCLESNHETDQIPQPIEFQGQTDFAEDSMLGSILNFEDLAEKLHELSPLMPRQKFFKMIPRELLINKSPSNLSTGLLEMITPQRKEETTDNNGSPTDRLEPRVRFEGSPANKSLQS